MKMLKRMIKQVKNVKKNKSEEIFHLVTQENVLPMEDNIRIKAYELWEQNGCPEGQSEYFWFKAIEELQNTDENKLCV
jgi:hypothetical protein